MSCLAVLVYEYIITFDDEVSTIWRRRWTAPSILLLTTRWNMMIQAVINFAPSTLQVNSHLL